MPNIDSRMKKTKELGTQLHSTTLSVYSSFHFTLLNEDEKNDGYNSVEREKCESTCIKILCAL